MKMKNNNSTNTIKDLHTGISLQQKMLLSTCVLLNIRKMEKSHSNSTKISSNCNGRLQLHNTWHDVIMLPGSVMIVAME